MSFGNGDTYTEMGTQRKCHMNVEMTLHLPAKEKALAQAFPSFVAPGQLPCFDLNLQVPEPQDTTSKLFLISDL